MKYSALIPSYLFLLAFYLFTLHDTQHLVPPYQILRPLIILWVFLGILVYPVYLVTSSWEWVGCMLMAVVFTFLISERFFKIVSLLLAGLFVFWQAYFRLRRYELFLRQFLYLSLALSVGFVLYALNLNAQHLRKVPWVNYIEAVGHVDDNLPKSNSPISYKPDIYYIVLDGYARSDILDELYLYDNFPFISYLDEKGFIVPGGVHANYAKTAVSITSTLNMNYVDSFAPGLKDSKFWWLMKPFIDHSTVRAFLETQGYTTISVSTNWSLTDNKSTNVYLHPYFLTLSDFEQYILRITPLRFLESSIQEFSSVPTYETHRETVEHSFQAFSKVLRVKEPKFVFVHILSPHPPFVFDDDGAHLDPPGNFSFNDANDFYGEVRDYQVGYIKQVEFVNSRMKSVIDTILTNSVTPPIIIIQSDHGSGLLTDFSSAENTCMRERFAPFAAYYLPDRNANIIPFDVTPVNIFRIVLNEYFNTDLPLLENQYYYFSDTVYLYRPIDVSSRITESCMPP